MNTNKAWSGRKRNNECRITFPFPELLAVLVKDPNKSTTKLSKEYLRLNLIAEANKFGALQVWCQVEKLVAF